MRKYLRILSLLLCVAMLAAALCACGGGTAVESPAPEQKEELSTGQPADTEPAENEPVELTVGIAQDLDDSLDPHSMVAAGTREVLFNVFEGLVKPDTNGNLIPAVASSYEIAETGDTFTFTLREGVKFHNGSAVTVGDVVYSISRAAGLETGEPLMPELASIISVEAPDDATIVIKTAEPNIELLANLTAAIIPEGSDPADGLVGTGPFKFVSRSAQENFIIEKFPEYWGEPASIDRVVYRIYDNAEAIVMNLKSGAVDMCAHLTAAQASELSNFTIIEGTMNLVQALYLNNSVEPLNDVRVRQAISCAIDPQEIMDFISDGRGTALGSSMYPAFGKYFDDSLTDYYAADPDRARSLLAEAGYPDGFDLKITVPSNYEPHIATAEVVVNQLANVGINAEIELITWESWLSDVYAGRNYMSTVVGFDASSMTASAMLARFVSDSPKNVSNFSDAEYDEVYAQAVACADEEQQVELFRRCEAILTEQAANAYIQDLCDLVALNPEFEGYEFYPLYVMDMSKIRPVGA